MTEEWKQIPGYEGYYEASNFGRIRSMDRKYTRTNPRNPSITTEYKKYGKVLSPGIYGYMYVNLSVGNKTKICYVHRLIAITFHPNPNGYKEVNHKDCNKENNHKDNLEWCDRKHNIKHGLDNDALCHGEKSCKAKISSEQMREICDLYSNTKLTQEQIGFMYNLSQSQVGNIVRGDSWKRVQNKHER